MDAATRWETEAIRSSGKKRSTPPRPTAKRTAPKRPNGTWLTLKEAEAATGIPTNTLRKWVRKDTVDSYLESDGELVMRMLRLESIVERADDLGRPIDAAPATAPEPDMADPLPQTPPADPPATAPHAPEAPIASIVAEPPEGTMLVPIDAWNKMLNQLGNLHEAGQMLADARERAAKAETEATFLRERLAEIRAEGPRDPAAQTEEKEPEADHVPEADHAPKAVVETTTYWRYLTTGWRDRKKRNV